MKLVVDLHNRFCFRSNARYFEYFLSDLAYHTRISVIVEYNLCNTDPCGKGVACKSKLGGYTCVCPQGQIWKREDKACKGLYNLTVI